MNESQKYCAKKKRPDTDYVMLDSIYKKTVVTESVGQWEGIARVWEGIAKGHYEMFWVDCGSCYLSVYNCHNSPNFTLKMDEF